MDENKITGAAQKLSGSTKEVASDVVGDTKLQVEGKADRLEGAARSVLGTTSETISDLADNAQDELSKLRTQVERLMAERVTPVLAEAAGAAQDYARQAKGIASEQSERVAATVKERPLLAIGLFAAVGFLVGRLAGGATYIDPRR